MRRTIRTLFLLALPSAPLASQGWIDERPVVPVRSSPAITRVSSTVRVVVDGRIARFEVEEKFRNSGRGIAEGTYHYPLPGEVVFSDFSLFQGETELKGEMMAAEQARSIYEGIVRQLKDPALITLVGHGLIRAQVFPIQPGETRTVILRYTQLMPRDGNALHLRYAAGSRGDAPVAVRFEIPRETEIATPYSPTHPISTARRNGVLHVTVKPPARGDIDLILPLRRGLLGGTVLTHANAGEDGYALLFLAPPASGETAIVPRDLTFVVDVSGSMSGVKMEQARTALRQALTSLRPGDRFRLIAFSSGVRHFRDGFTAVNSRTLTEAREFVNALAATGGTNLEGAVNAALSDRADAERMSLVFLMSDGVPSVGEQAPDRIAANAAGRIGRHRIFTFGVGHDVNTYLLDRLAVEGRGTATYVAPEANVSDAVGGVLTKLSRPALSDLRIVSAPVRFIDQAPTALPDLFYGEELVILSRYRGTGDGPVVIEGSRNGRRERFEIAGRFVRNTNDNEYIAPLWASRRIGELSRQARIEGASAELIAQIRELGLRYGILTEYTSYLVQEPGAANLATDRISNGLTRQPGVVAAPSASGAQAFESARSDAAMSRSSTLAEARDQAASKQATAARGVSLRARAEMKSGGNHTFVLRKGVWTDVAHTDSMTTTTIAPYSPAWFAIVKARPALAEALAIGDPLVVAGKRVSLKVAAGGLTEWKANAMERFLKDFDGR
ncbi:MAG: VWA domain-containing protein [Gemmatimonadales bacterium]|nr:VWA domain-containing protein [Gemmatimonadales bacterium]